MTSPPAQENGQYLVLFDPLDGSSNIDINMCVGIFSILPAKNAVTQAEDFMRPGVNQAVAGYDALRAVNHDGFDGRRWRGVLYL